MILVESLTGSLLANPNQRRPAHFWERSDRQSVTKKRVETFAYLLSYLIADDAIVDRQAAKSNEPTVNFWENGKLKQNPSEIKRECTQ